MTDVWPERCVTYVHIHALEGHTNTVLEHRVTGVHTDTILGHRATGVHTNTTFEPRASGLCRMQIKMLEDKHGREMSIVQVTPTSHSCTHPVLASFLGLSLNLTCG